MNLGLPRRRLVRIALALTVLGVAGYLAGPDCYWRCVGWWGRESFYAGRPTSYWRAELARWFVIPVPGLHEPPGVLVWVQRPPAWLRPLVRQAGTVGGYRLWNDHDHRCRTLPWGPGSVPVLIELLDDPDWETRRKVVFHLAELGEAARPAVPALLKVRPAKPAPEQYFSREASFYRQTQYALSRIAPALEREPVARGLD